MSFFSIDWSKSAKNQTSKKEPNEPIVPQIRIEKRVSRKKSSSLRSKFLIDQKQSHVKFYNQYFFLLQYSIYILKSHNYKSFQHRNQSEIYQGNLLKFVKEYSAADSNQNSEHDAEKVALSIGFIRGFFLVKIFSSNFSFRI